MSNTINFHHTCFPLNFNKNRIFAGAVHPHASLASCLRSIYSNVETNKSDTTMNFYDNLFNFLYTCLQLTASQALISIMKKLWAGKTMMILISDIDIA